MPLPLFRRLMIDSFLSIFIDFLFFSMISLFFFFFAVDVLIDAGAFFVFLSIFD